MHSVVFFYQPPEQQIEDILQRCILRDLCHRRPAGVNFTNILRVAFSYKSFAQSFFVLEVWVKLFLAQGNWCKWANKMLVKLTTEGDAVTSSDHGLGRKIFFIRFIFGHNDKTFSTVETICLLERSLTPFSPKK